MSNKTFYITTPIYYVNDIPHIGHAYTTILADVLASYHRLLGEPTYFLTGTDEHGQKVQQAAEAGKITPQEQADRTVVRFQDLWKKLEITNNDFIRTTEPRHKEVVQSILQDLYDKDEIYRDEYDGWYCVGCERFFMEDDLDDNKCPECGRRVDKVSEVNYFFRMSKYQEWLVQYINDHPAFIQPNFRRNETLGFLRKPLKDLCISRPKARLNWGIELPFDNDFVTYVWFDALINYISAIAYGKNDEMFSAWWPATYHMIGKDILTTHSVYWPTMLKAIGLPMPGTIFAHGWWLMKKVDSDELDKMSKSLGNVVNPMDMIDQYGVDAFRYFLISEMTLGQDATFTEDAFAKRYNADLANDLGNLLSRLLNMIGRYCDGSIPDMPSGVPDGPDERELWSTVQAAVDDMESSIGNMRLDYGISRALTAIRAINRYLEIKQPWHLAKQDDREPLHITLYTAGESLRVCAALLYPVMPKKMGDLRNALGLSAGPPDFSRLRNWGLLASGTKVQKPEALFPRKRLEDKGAGEAAPESKPAGPRAEPSSGTITYEEFSKVELKTAKVLAAEKVKGADKLLQLQVEIGEERRQLVAGVAQHYEPEALIGKTVVVVANLKPAKIRGIRSQGMLLAATQGDQLRLITVDGDLASGAPVK